LPTLYSIGDRRMSMEHWRNDADRENPKYSGRKMSQCHFVHHKAHMDGNGVEPGLFWRQTGYQSTNPRHGLHIFLTDLTPNQSQF